jgi:dihydroflavonol-4-reductase
MKILVTGGTGYLGVALLKLLHQLYPRECTLYALVRKDSPKARLAGLPIEFVTGDILHAPSLWKATKGIDVVFHVAGLVSFEQRRYRQLYKTNVVGTRNVVDACLKNGVKRLIYTSSTAAIGVNSDGTPSNEESAFQGWQRRIGYMVSKYLAELEVMRGIAEGLDAVMLNPGIVIGNSYGVDNVASRWFREVFLGKVPFYPRGGAGFVDIHDVAMAHILAWQKGRCGERYIIVAQNWSYHELFEELAKYGGRSRSAVPLSWSLGRLLALGTELLYSLSKQESPITLDGIRLSERRLFYDNRKSRQELGLNYTAFGATLERLLDSYKLLFRRRSASVRYQKESIN